MSFWNKRKRRPKCRPPEEILPPYRPSEEDLPPWALMSDDEDRGWRLAMRAIGTSYRPPYRVPTHLNPGEQHGYAAVLKGLGICIDCGRIHTLTYPAAIPSPTTKKPRPTST